MSYIATKNPGSAGVLVLLECTTYAVTFPFAFAITSSAMLLGAEA